MSKKHYIFSKSWHRDYVFFLSVHLTLFRVLAPSPVEKSVGTRAVAQRGAVETVVEQVGGKGAETIVVQWGLAGRVVE